MTAWDAFMTHAHMLTDTNIGKTQLESNQPSASVQVTGRFPCRDSFYLPLINNKEILITASLSFPG